MKVQELFKKQEELDNFIMEKLKNKGVPIIDVSQLLAYRLLALSTEIGELAGAGEREKLDELADVMHFVMSVGNLAKINIPYADTKFRIMYELLKLRTELTWLEVLESFIIAYSKFANTTRCFKYWSTSNKEMVKEYLEMAYIDMFVNFIYLGHSLNFTAMEVEEAYLKKNEINYQRQENGY